MKLRNKLLVAAGIAGAALLACEVFVENVQSLPVILPDGFTVTAHTGCEKTKDNSLDAITIGYGYGADIVEFDLNFNEEGVPVLSHDTPTGNEVTLDEAFALIATYNGLLVNVDVKNTADLKQVVSLAEKYDILSRIFFTGVTEDDVEEVKNSGGGVAYYLNKDIDKSRIDDIAYINELCRLVKETGAIGLNISYKACSQLMIDELHKQGLKISLWTVNSRRDMKKVLSMGCDNITTRKVSDLIELIKE